MSTVDYSNFLADVVPYVRDCPEFVAITAIRSACMEFCEQSLYWRQSLDAMDIVVGQDEYTLDIESGTGVASVVESFIGERPIEFKSTDQLNQLMGLNWRQRTGAVQYLTQETPDTIRVVPIPDVATSDQLYITIALRPLRTSTRVLKDIYERYAEVIAFGARARLHDTPGQPYYDEEAAMRYRKWFQSGYGKATIDRNRAGGRGPLLVRNIRV